MKLTMDDPKLTAYALGELDAAARADIARELAQSPGLQAEVEAIRRTSEQLNRELAGEPCPEFTLEESAAPIAAPRTAGVAPESVRHPEGPRRDPPPSEAGWSWLLRLFFYGGATAMILLVAGALLLPALSKAKAKAKRVSRLSELRQMALEDQFRSIPPSAVPTAPPGRWTYSPHNTESYDHVEDNPFLTVQNNPLSTFSIDVDTASYALVRRFIEQQRTLPPKGAVRIEELINYFTYDYPPPRGRQPFSVNVEIAGCPWKAEHRLARIGLKGREITRERAPACNLVFLVDVSGSMNMPNKLPLVKQSLELLARQLREQDSVAMVVYAGSSGLVLPPTSGAHRSAIIRAIERLSAGGSTHGSAGIRQAYEEAQRGFIERGVNRVILCTDGDFNVGVTSQSELVDLIEQKAKSGVFLSVLGFGMGNLKDSTLEKLADKGNGNYAFIDTFAEAQKVFGEQLLGTLVTIAKDVKIQVEFNPAHVAGYRLIGYENRMLRVEDFNDDRKDAGEIGAGHTVTALYEIVPVGLEVPAPDVDPLKYQRPVRPARGEASDEVMTIKLRYKEPDGDTSELIDVPVADTGRAYRRASEDFKLATSVAAFGMILRDSPYKGSASFDSVLELAEEGVGGDRSGYRQEFLKLVEQASQLAPQGNRR
jgi:Ca-activated chloride channel homolog